MNTSEFSKVVDNSSSEAGIPSLVADESQGAAPFLESDRTGALEAAVSEVPKVLPTFATIDEIADLLRLERKAVYRLAQRGELPGCRRLGRTFRVHLETVISWFRTGQRRDRKRERSS